MLPSTRGLEEAAARFMREARAAARLKSQHTVRVYDVGRFESGEPYMVMEHLEGCDLKQQLKSGGPLEMTLAVDGIMQVCEALAEAHAMGIIHRDLKPSNLFATQVSSGACIKVLDFGISKLIGALAEHDSDLTQTAALLGTPAYMSPEQMAEARDIDARTDVWSLGVILYELLTGEKPFQGRSVPAITMAVASQEVPPLRARRPDVPVELETVVLRCLSKSREGRYPDVGSLARALVPFASPESATLLDRIAATERLSVPPSFPLARGSTPPLSDSGRLARRAPSQPVTPPEPGPRALEPPTRALAAPALAPPAPASSRTAASWGADRPHPTGARHMPRVVIGAGVALIALALAATWTLSSRREPQPAALPEEAAAAATSEAPTDAPTASESAASRAASSPPPSSTAPSSTAIAPRRPPPRPRPAAPASKPPSDPFGEGWR
jgi:serine/threonine-protein kinase